MNPNQQASQQSVPEAQISPPVQQQAAPDLVSQQGKQALASKLSKTIEKKDFLDYILKGIAEKAGVEFSSRVKNPETVVQKVASKRMEGRKYGLNDVNDVYGGRFIIKSPDQVKEIKTMLDKASELGVFKIGKQENVTQATYKAKHLDIITPDGIKGEIQIMTHPQAAEAVINHDLRAVHGEKPPLEVKELRDAQAKIVKSLSNSKNAKLVEDVQNIHKQAGDKPLPATVNAAMLAAIKSK